MGAVYLARRADRQYEQQVAMKLIKRGMDTEAMLRRFRNERQILAGFDHPNIARLLDGDTTDDGLPYFVMEYVEGLPIDEYCDRQALDVTGRLQLFRQVCAAVSYAHRRAVIHRDLKCSNILVGSDGVPKLLDFGIARLLQAGDAAESPVTMLEQRVMTPEYASPEHLRGEPVTTASDVYSLGVVLYRLLTGQLPHRLKAQSAEDMARTVGQTEPQRPSAVVEATSSRRLRGDLDNIVLMALRKEPERRYPSVEQFSEDIRRHLESAAGAGATRHARLPRGQVRPAQHGRIGRGDARRPEPGRRHRDDELAGAARPRAGSDRDRREGAGGTAFQRGAPARALGAVRLSRCNREPARRHGDTRAAGQ